MADRNVIVVFKDSVSDLWRWKVFNSNNLKISELEFESRTDCINNADMHLKLRGDVIQLYKYNTMSVPIENIAY